MTLRAAILHRLVLIGIFGPVHALAAVSIHAAFQHGQDEIGACVALLLIATSMLTLDDVTDLTWRLAQWLDSKLPKTRR